MKSDDPIVTVDIGIGPQPKMLSIGDDIVAECYRDHGPRAFEPTSLMLWFELAKQAQYAMDVGAFTGIYGLVAVCANPSIKVAAIEPSKIVFSRLCLNIQINKFQSQIGPLNMAAGERYTECLLNHYDGVYCLNSGSTLLDVGQRPFWYSESVRMLPLDILPSLAGSDQRFTVIELPRSAPDIVKIDVEGLELEVLKGMRRTAKEHAPIFIIECLSADALRAVREFLDQYSYRSLLIDDDKFSLAEGTADFSASTRNILFYPRDKRDMIEKLAIGIGLDVKPAAAAAT